MSAHEALTRALADLADKGRRPPCANKPERWTGDDPTTHEDAATDCAGCPLLTPCDEAAAAESWGVWAGRCRCTPRHRDTRKRTA